MRTLPAIRPTKEQLALISENRYGVEVIRGAAGSGKTSTAILRLRSLLYMVQERLAREGIDRPAQILVLTFNRTLSGYIRILATEQIKGAAEAQLTIETFARWAMSHLGWPRIISNEARDQRVQALARALPLSPRYVANEVDYLFGRFERTELDRYLMEERTGRGTEPRVDRTLRRRILDEVVVPYQRWLEGQKLLDWNELAVRMLHADSKLQHDIAIIDDSQDFSANQLRAVRAHLGPDYAVTFVIDTIQRIYSRGFASTETGFEMRRARYHTLVENHRNTRQIAQFATGILSGMAVEPDGAMPNLAAAKRDGPLPVVLKGLYSRQVQAALAFIKQDVDLKTQSVAFLAPLGGGFFDFLKNSLVQHHLTFVEITRESEWPEGPENIALSTFHSAKGLEFDHVIILGLNAQNTMHEDLAVGDQLVVLRRLLAVAVARARETLHVGYKVEERSRLVDYFAPGTFEERVL